MGKHKRYKTMVEDWKKERDEAIRKQDVSEFKKFYAKWLYSGAYELPLPDNDKVIEIALRKMLYNLPTATPEEKETARKWLLSHGCSTNLNMIGAEE